MAESALLAPAAERMMSSPAERRLMAEWELLERVVARNPARLGKAQALDRSFHVELLATPAIVLESFEDGLRDDVAIVHEHGLRIEFPRYFPAAPLELYLDEPVEHPNIHPETGFVCLWAEHRVEHTIADALRKTVAILGWRLLNLDVVHRMQPGAWAVAASDREAVAARLMAQPLELLGVADGPEIADGPDVADGSAAARKKTRRRLS